MSQYKVSLHDCNKGPNNYKTAFWRDKTAVSIGKLVRKRITTKIVIEILRLWDSFPETILESPVWRNYLERTQIKEYETKP